jgi:hypothetical protein
MKFPLVWSAAVLSRPAAIALSSSTSEECTRGPPAEQQSRACPAVPPYSRASGRANCSSAPCPLSREALCRTYGRLGAGLVMPRAQQRVYSFCRTDTDLCLCVHCNAHSFSTVRQGDVEVVAVRALPRSALTLPLPTTPVPACVYGTPLYTSSAHVPRRRRTFRPLFSRHVAALHLVGSACSLPFA